MSEVISYQDQEGKPATLHKLVRTEPDWAASRIKFMDYKIVELNKELSSVVAGLFSEDELAIRDLEQQAKGIIDALDEDEITHDGWVSVEFLQDCIDDYQCQAKALKGDKQ
jgi:hypothetical protein